MAAVTEGHRRGSEDRRKGKKRKCSRSKNKPKKGLYWWLIISLLFVSPGAASLPVEGRKGDNITLPCSLTNREDLTTLLTFGHITVFGFNQHKCYNGRVHKNGSCNLILEDLKTTDAGKYVSQVFASGQLPNMYTYDVHVKVSLTGWKGEELMFDDLPREAENVEHLTNAGCTEVWRRGQGVLTDRLTHKNDCLAINNFTSSDAGLYRVLNPSGETLVTVMVTESSTGSKDRLDRTHEDEPHDTKRVHVWIGIGVLVALILFAVIMNHSASEQERGTQFLTRGPTERNCTGAQIN